MKKKLFSLFLLLGLVLCLTVSVSAEEVSGTFDAGTWTYNTDTATLTISGEGDMGNFLYGGAPWKEYASQIRTAIIEPGFTTAGNYAFQSCTALTSVSLPEGITSIEDYCFHNCTALNKLGLPDTLETIGESAFCSSGLTGIQFPTSLKEIGWSAFADCESLLTVTIPGNVKTIGTHAFEGCTSLLKLTINDGVEKIDSHAFDSCTSLLDVTIPGSVSQMSNNIFLNCDSLRSAAFKEGVTAVPPYAFYDCENLASVSLPSTLRSIENFAFVGCKKLDNVVIPEGVTTISTEAFTNCSGMTNVSLPATLTSMGAGVFSGCSSLTQVTIPGSLSAVPGRTFDGCSNLEQVTIEEGVVTLGHSLFKHCNSLKELHIPSSVTDIAGEMCYSCDSLKKVVFESGTVNIAGLAFQHCENLEEVILPDTLQSIGADAFADCSSLKTITIPGSVTTIGNRAFSGSGVSSVTVKRGMLQLPSYSLSQMKKLIYVVLPDTMLLVNDFAFSGSTKLCHALITGPATEIVVNRGNDAFANATKHFNAQGNEITVREDCTSIYAYCSLCDQAIHSEAKTTPEHNFGQWVVSAPPTTHRVGEEIRKCSVCDFVEKRSIPMLPAEKNPFTDVPADSFYEIPVIWAVEKGITTGMSATTFAPDDSCTRAQVVTFLWRSANSPEPETNRNPFTDVKETAYYYKAVLWAVEKGITTGMSATTFAPDDSCTRAQVATFLWRAQGKPGVSNTNNTFTDVTSGAYYYNAVLWAVENNITNGMGGGKFAPDSICNRSQIVTFLYRCFAGQ